MRFISLQILVSFAYKDIFVPGYKELNISLINNTNNKGPKMEPWGAPEFTGNFEEATLQITTCCCLPSRYNRINRTINKPSTLKKIQ